jgi:uncharacterized membrane protein
MTSKYLIPLLILLVVVDVPLLLLATYLKNRPPGTVNSFYGYRTTRSMKNHTTWVEANQYSSRLFYISCLSLLLIQAIVAVIWDGFTALNVTLAFIVIQALTVFISTEIHLSKRFDEQGDGRK